MRELELELAQNKVRLVDEQCRLQETSHQLQRSNAELEELKAAAASPSPYNPRQWLAKKWTTATTKSGNAADEKSRSASTSD